MCVCQLVSARVCYKSHSSSPNDFLYCPLYKARNHLRVLRGSGGGAHWTHDNSTSRPPVPSKSSADQTAGLEINYAALTCSVQVGDHL